MYQHQIRTLVALIVIFGHIGVFLFGFLMLGILVQNFSSDTLQIILMASPVLGATAVAAVKYILGQETATERGSLVDIGFAIVVISIPSILICMIGILFVITYYRLNGFSIDSLKISLGFLETFFAIFMTAISDRLFGTQPDARPKP